MKKLLSLVAIALAFASCESDDDNNNESSSASIVGTFVLTNFDSPINDDYNNDGTTSSNLLDEVPCFENTISFSENGNYTSSATTLVIEIDDNSTTAGCEGPFIETGTYNLEGDTLSITQETTTDPDGDVDISFNDATASITASGLTLTVASVFGNATFIYERQ